MSEEYFPQVKFKKNCDSNPDFYISSMLDQVLSSQYIMHLKSAYACECWHMSM